MEGQDEVIVCIIWSWFYGTILSFTFCQVALISALNIESISKSSTVAWISPFLLLKISWKQLFNLSSLSKRHKLYVYRDFWLKNFRRCLRNSDAFKWCVSLINNTLTFKAILPITTINCNSLGLIRLCSVCWLGLRSPEIPISKFREFNFSF